MTDEIVRTQTTVPSLTQREGASPWPPLGDLLMHIYPGTLHYAEQNLGRVSAFFHTNGLLLFFRDRTVRPAKIRLRAYTVGTPEKLASKPAKWWRCNEVYVIEEGSCGCGDPLKALGWGTAKTLLDFSAADQLG